MLDRHSAEDGMGTPQTLTQLFFDAVDQYSSKAAALRHKAGGKWHDLTHQELARRVRHTALGLKELGVRPGDRVAILSPNRPEWAIADYACLTARCADVPVYPTLPARQVAYVLRDSGAVAVFVSDRDQYAKIAETRGETPALRHVILFEGDVSRPGVVVLSAVEQMGASAEAKYPRYKAEALEARPDDLATLIYTSGTTGDPKGVMLTHGNFSSNVVSALKVLPVGPSDSALSLLPLSHSFERMAGHYTLFHAGLTVSYAESLETVGPNMLEVRPTVVLAVPRLYEKIYGRVLEGALSGGALKRRIFFWAKRNAEAWADLVLAGKPVPAGFAAKKKLADRLVFSKLQARTGGRIRFFVSGGAPLSPDIAKFFYAAGLPILEGYGLTETSPVIAVNGPDAHKIGTVGRPIPGVEVRIAEDGEILARGPNIMKGYFNKPEATREAIDAQGWFHTGDIGELDADGYLRITDRKKDIIVTAGGKNIAPQPIENQVKTNKFIANAVMIGDKRKFPIMLVVPNRDPLTAWAKERGLPADDYDRLLGHVDAVAKIEREVMGNLRDLASYETPKKFVLIRDDFTIENGELTPTLKVKRRVVEKKYADRIEAVYASGNEA
jgi:long-chain acyl-CoA synthetase